MIEKVMGVETELREREQSHSFHGYILGKKNKQKAALCLHLSRKCSEARMTSSERTVLSLQIKLHYSLVFIIMTLLLCLIIHYYVSPLLLLLMILFFNLIIKPLPLISHCLFSVFCFHGASDMIVFHFPQAARMERTERYWKKEALPVPGTSCLTEFLSKALCLQPTFSRHFSDGMCSVGEEDTCRNH